MVDKNQSGLQAGFFPPPRCHFRYIQEVHLVDYPCIWPSIKPTFPVLSSKSVRALKWKKVGRIVGG